MSMNTRPTLAMFGSSLVSAYWNGAATYYRGILHALHERGVDIVFYEPDAYQRQQHRDIADPSWARVIVYPATDDGVQEALEDAGAADLLVKASGVGVYDDLLEAEVPRLARAGKMTIFWDVDAPATLERMRTNPHDPFREQVSKYDLVLTYGGGPPVVQEYEQFGARECVPIYNALDPSTHYPVPPDERFSSDLAFLGNRLPDREARVREFFLEPGCKLPDQTFVLGGSGWGGGIDLPRNVRYVGHVYTRDHNAFNCSPRMVININRDSMARTGFSPPTRVFEAAGAAACLICDAWQGIEQFLEPDREVLCVGSGAEVASLVQSVDPQQARRIGKAARARILSEHTYAHRAARLYALLQDRPSRSFRTDVASRAASSASRERFHTLFGSEG
jgi:spore maturation protein CgeB